MPSPGRQARRAQGQKGKPRAGRAKGEPPTRRLLEQRLLPSQEKVEVQHLPLTERAGLSLQIAAAGQQTYLLVGDIHPLQASVGILALHQPQ